MHKMSRNKRNGLTDTHTDRHTRNCSYVTHHFSSQPQSFDRRLSINQSSFNPRFTAAYTLLQESDTQSVFTVSRPRQHLYRKLRESR